MNHRAIISHTQVAVAQVFFTPAEGECVFITPLKRLAAARPGQSNGFYFELYESASVLVLHSARGDARSMWMLDPHVDSTLHVLERIRSGGRFIARHGDLDERASEDWVTVTPDQANHMLEAVELQRRRCAQPQLDTFLARAISPEFFPFHGTSRHLGALFQCLAPSASSMTTLLGPEHLDDMQLPNIYGTN